jgi:hypothetical protein
VGQGTIAARVRDGVAGPPDLVDLESLVAMVVPVIRQMLSAPLPEKGTPALLPNERLPQASGGAQVRAIRSRAPEPVAAVRVERSEPTPADRTTPDETGAAPSPAAKPAPRPRPSHPPNSAQRVQTQPTLDGSDRVVRRAVPGPQWLELTALPPLTAQAGSRSDWVEDAADALEVGPGDGVRISADAQLDLTYDPGVPQVPIRSPVTGEILTARDLEAQYSNSAMPSVGPRADVMEARPAFEREITDLHRLSVAVYLPGPVMTGPGLTPRKLCAEGALGLTDTEVVLGDTDNANAAAVRLELRSIERLEVVGGQQVTLCLTDGRQLHLDLRRLRDASFVAAGEVLEGLERAIRASGGH